MNVLAAKLAPIILIFIIGIILRKLKVFEQEHADLFLKLAFYVSFPASIILSISKIRLTIELMFIPITAVGVILVSFVVSRTVGSFYKLPKPTFGAFLISTMIMNVSFMLPFLLASHGQNGLARVVLFDFGNALVALTFTYAVAVKYGNEKISSSEVIFKLIKSPSFWALIIAFVLNIRQIQLPLVADENLKILGQTLTPLLLLALGIRFSLSLVNSKATITAIALRMILGLLLGMAFASIFKLDGLNRIVVLICSAAPVGFSALTFSSMENLDTQLAASLVSVSVFIGMFSTTLLLFALS